MILLIAVGIIVVVLLTFLRDLPIRPRPNTPSQTPSQTSGVNYSKEYPVERARDIFESKYYPVLFFKTSC